MRIIFAMLVWAYSIGCAGATAPVNPKERQQRLIPPGITMLVCTYETSVDRIFAADDGAWGKRIQETGCVFTALTPLHRVEVDKRLWSRSIEVLYNGKPVPACVTVFKTHAYADDGERLDFHMAVIRRHRGNISGNGCLGLPNT